MRLLSDSRGSVSPRQRSWLRPKWLNAFVPQSASTTAFASVAVIQCIICATIEVLFLVRYDHAINFKGMINFAVIPFQVATILFELLYQVFLVLDAGRRKNVIEAFGVCVNNVSLFVFALITYYVNHDLFAQFWLEEFEHHGWQNSRRLLMALPATLGIMTLIMTAVAWKLLNEFSW